MVFNLKKTIAVVITLLIGCDVSLLFAQENNVEQQQLAQVQQLQQMQASPAFAAPGDNVQGSFQQAMQQYATQPVQLPPPSQVAQLPSQQSLLPSSPSLANALTPPAPTPTVNDLSDAAFKEMARSTLPMTPEQIQRLRQLFNASQSAASAMPGTPPRPTATSQFVSLAPGTTPPVIRLAQGFVTSLVFIDSTGSSWPIDSYDIGNPQAFNIQWNRTDNILMIQAQSLYTYGNLAIRLKGLVTPVMLTLIPGQKAVDYRVDLRIQGLGPNAQGTPQGNGVPSGANPVLLNVLDGIPPDGSQPLKLMGGEGQVWVLGDRLYLRTPLTVLSPGWISTLSSADGMKAYEMMRTSMILVADHGKSISLKVEGF